MLKSRIAGSRDLLFTHWSVHQHWMFRKWTTNQNSNSAWALQLVWLTTITKNVTWTWYGVYQDTSCTPPPHAHTHSHTDTHSLVKRSAFHATDVPEECLHDTVVENPCTHRQSLYHLYALSIPKTPDLEFWEFVLRSFICFPTRTSYLSCLLSAVPKAYKYHLRAYNIITCMLDRVSNYVTECTLHALCFKSSKCWSRACPWFISSGPL